MCNANATGPDRKSHCGIIVEYTVASCYEQDTTVQLFQEQKEKLR